jgi:hypothetical protein
MTPPLALLRVEPTSHRDVLAFRDYTDGTGDFGEVRIPVYPASPRGAELRAMRQAMDMRAGELGRILGIGPVEVLYLEQGNYTLSDEDWARVFEAVRSVRKERG